MTANTHTSRDTVSQAERELVVRIGKHVHTHFAATDFHTLGDTTRRQLHDGLQTLQTRCKMAIPNHTLNQRDRALCRSLFWYADNFLDDKQAFAEDRDIISAVTSRLHP